MNDNISGLSGATTAHELKLARPNVEPWELKANYDISTRSDRIITAQVRYFLKLNDYRLFILGAGNCANEKPWA
jgi:hypothetical protein